MAIFTQIGGISSGSISNVFKGPLAKLFGKKTGAAHYKYPENLTDDPSRMHFIQFQISNITPVQFNVDTVQSMVDTVEKIVDTKQSIQSKLEYSKKQSMAMISLYMPDSLNISYPNSYDQVNMTAAGKVLNVASEAMDAFKNGKGLMSGLKSIAQADPLLVDAAIRYSPLGAENADLVLKSVGAAVNPQIQMLYRGNGFRKFQFEFMLTAKSKEESDQISAICNAFIYASTPTVAAGTGMFFTPPSIFNISLMMAKTTNLGALSAMLQKAGNSLGSGIGSKIGNAMGGATATENTRLFKTGDCVLEDVTVDYAPDGWAAHTGGAPLQTKLTLQFSEIHIIHRARLLSGDVR